MQKHQINFSLESKRTLREKYGCRVYPLPQIIYEVLEKCTKAMTQIAAGQKVEPHTHEFLSFYLAKNNCLEFDGKQYLLPVYCLVVVDPGVIHPWINITSYDDSWIGDLSPDHGPQIVTG